MAYKDLKIKYTKLFINNEFVDSISGKTFPTINPANEKLIADVSEALPEDINAAVAAAKAAFERNSPWRKMDASERGKLINKLADLLEKNIEELTLLESLDGGKTLHESLGDIQLGIDTLRYYAGICDKVQGTTIPADGCCWSLTRKEPIGVVGQIIPWNYPLLMLIWKWGPALAAGCTIVFKPAELTPLTALYAAALSKETGFPPGVINVVPGYGQTAGAAIASHMDVDKISFTGSTITGRLIMELAAKSNLKKVSLELGGKSPLVIFNDADLDSAVQIAHDAIFASHGQNCCAGSRTFVQSKIYDEFVKRATELAKNRKVGDPANKDIQQGPQIEKKALDKILRLIQTGIKEGAKLETGGQRIGTKGFFVQPTVFSNVTDNMTIAKEEIFGPVQSILKFDTLEEVIERANNTSYGLAAGVITKNMDDALSFAQAVRAGSVWVNCYDVYPPQNPFGGFKQSGIGRELGFGSVDEYMEEKLVSIKVPSKC